MTNEQTPSMLEKFNQWISESITVKLASIGILMLLLLIPSQWVIFMMEERESRAESSMEEIFSKWSGRQLLSGPILVLPYEIEKKETMEVNKQLVMQTNTYIEKLFVLPEELNIQANIEPTILHRGIFDAAVYQSVIQHQVKFQLPEESKSSIKVEKIRWKDAYLIYSVSDQRGISDLPAIIYNNKPLQAEPSQNIGILVERKLAVNNYDVSMEDSNLQVDKRVHSTGFKIPLNWEQSSDISGDISIQLNIKGSEELFFLPLGKNTRVQAKGNWANPSFDGEFLPTNREVTDSAFTADWKILHFNRAFDEFWTQPEKKLEGGEFGLKLKIPADQYQKSIRTAKYGQLIIMLTFLALFLVEVIKKIRIHPFQYLLIAAALIIYYTLLISLSEQTGFNIAYVIASTLTIILVSFYSRTFLSTLSLTLLFAILLVSFYGFIFIIIVQQELSLLLGSFGLFLIISAVMYFSRKIKWYNS